MNSPKRNLSFFENVLHNSDNAASYTDYPKGLLEKIKTCNSIYSFHFPVSIAHFLERCCLAARLHFVGESATFKKMSERGLRFNIVPSMKDLPARSLHNEGVIDRRALFLY